jgi:hypothetical protein
MKMTFWFLLEMSDYNQYLIIFCPQFTMRNVLVKLLVMELKLTEIDKFIAVTWLLHKAYLENVLRSIVCMHIKTSMSWESRVMRLRIDKVPWIDERSIKWNEFQVLQLSQVLVCSSKICSDLVPITRIFWHV